MNNEKYAGNLSLQEPLLHYTTWRVGGPAKQFYRPAGIEDLSNFLRDLPEGEPLFWLGLGSNLLIRDKGYLGTVILTQGCLKGIDVVEGKPDLVRVEAGVSCAKMARFCARSGLSGGEFWAGIPGTMGGALRMNAGCSGRETWEYVVEVETITRTGELKIRHPEEFEVSYRHVSGLDNEAFVAATCRMIPGEKEQSLQLIKNLLAHRANTQPINESNCGSVFRNPAGDYAARLIEACGLKFKQIGGAMVSGKHANFIINYENKATANDIETLIQFVKNKIFETFHIELIPEVHIIGESE